MSHAISRFCSRSLDPVLVPRLTGHLIRVSSSECHPCSPAAHGWPYIVDNNGYRVRLNAVNWYGAEGSDYVVMGLQAQTISVIVSEIKSRGSNAVGLPWSRCMRAILSSRTLV